MMLRPLAAAMFVALAATPVTASAQNWMIGARALYVSPNVSTSINGLDVDAAWWGEVDFTYFFTKNIAAELIAGWNKHEVTLNGASLGKVGVLPPTLTLQYHFTDLGAFKPYIGAGLNYTYFYDDELANNTLHIKDSSWGGALQAGLDYEFTKNWYFNADVKYVWMNTDVIVNATGANLGSLDINPWIFGVGVRYRF
jgi:outer membrane protein